MKTLISVVTALIISMSVQTTEAKPIKTFERLLNENRMFELRDLYAKEGHQLEVWYRLYYKAYIDNAFGREEESVRAIDEIFTKYKSNLSHSKLADMLSCQSDNYAKLFEYKKAAEALSKALTDYKKVLTRTEEKNLLNMLGLYQSISSVPPQQIIKFHSEELPITVNSFNHWLIPGRATRDSEVQIQFIFDTGAGYSTLREGIADDFGVVYLNQTVKGNNSLGDSINLQMGYIPVLYLGDMEIRNIVVMILPDEMLTFEEVNYTVDAIIGAPIISALGEFSITKNNILKISKNNSEGVEQNMFSNGNTPYVQAFYNEDTLTLLCDTGANNSNISSRYYKKNRNIINTLAEKGTTTIGGAGGVEKLNVREHKNAKIKVASREFQVPNLLIHTKSERKSKTRDGFLGQDVLLQSAEVVINLKDKYLFFKD